MTKYVITLTFFSSIANLHLSGQSLTPIQTDRPDQTESPFIVPKNHFQIESGINYEEVNNKEKNFLYPTVLWKYGVNEKFELRLISEILSNQKCGETFNGINPIKIGLKTQLLEENGLIPTTSLIVHMSIPYLSSENLKSTYFAPGFRFTMQHTLTEKISLGYNLGSEWDGEKAEPTFIYTLTSGFSLSEKIGAYLELYGFAPQQSEANHRADGGLTYFMRSNIMFDISGGIGLTANAPKYYGSLGFSIRLPN